MAALAALAQLTDVGLDRVEAVAFRDGTEVPADLVVMAVGIRPNIELAKASGLACERGVLVDDTLQSYDPSIYAVGECVQHRGTCYGLVAPLFDQAKVCANHLAHIGIGRYEGSVDWQARAAEFDRLVEQTRQRRAPLFDALVPVSGKNTSGKTEGGFSWQVVAIPAAVEGGSLRPGALQDIEVVVGWEDGRKNRQVRLHSVVAGRGE